MNRNQMTYLVMCSGMTMSCVVSPFDGQRVGATTTSVRFDGYWNFASAPIEIQALNPMTRTFDRVGTATASARPDYRFWDLDWHPWTLSTSIPAPYWAPGATGSFARVRAMSGGNTLYTMSEGFYACFARHAGDPIGTFVDRCAAGNTPTVVVCTSDFTPFGSRRGPCPHRALDIIQADGKRVRSFLPDVTTTLSEGGTNTAEWRGDTVSHIDIFDRVMAGSEDRAIVNSDGISWGQFVRLQYPRARSTEAFRTYRLNEIATAAGLPLAWTTGRSVRQYDRGECSLTLTWREILDLLVTGIDTIGSQVAAQTDGLVRLIPHARTSITPVLRSLGPDRLHLYQEFLVDSLIGQTTIRVKLDLRLVVNASSSLAVVVDRVDVTASSNVWATIEREALEVIHDFVPAVPSFSDFLANLDRAAVEDAINNLLASGLGPLATLVDVRRVNVKPEGVEFVAAEDTQDAQFELIDRLAPALCDRFAGLTQTAGYFGVVFEPSLRGDPPVFGNLP